MDYISTGILILFVVLFFVGRVRAGLKRRKERMEIEEHTVRRAKLGLEVSGDMMQKVAINRLSSVRSEKIIAVVNIFGPILTDPGATPPFARGFATYGEQVKDILYQLKSDDRVCGVLVRINTPGGTVPGSEAIREGIEECNKTKPVYVHVSGMSASGGVWAMSGARRIIADRESMIGSIGIIGPTIFTYEDVSSLGQGILGNAVTGKIRATVLYEGKGKAFGSPYVEADEEVLENFRELLKRVYQRFQAIVLAGRKQVDPLELYEMGAQIVDADAALEKKLIDAVGSRRQAEQELLKEAGASYLDSSFVLIQSPVRSRFSALLAEYLPAFAPQLSHNSKQALVGALSQETVLAVSPLWMHGH